MMTMARLNGLRDRRWQLDQRPSCSRGQRGLSKAKGIVGAVWVSGFRGPLPHSEGPKVFRGQMGTGRDRDRCTSVSWRMDWALWAQLLRSCSHGGRSAPKGL